MREHIGKGIGAIAFIAILIAVLISINTVLEPKYYFQNMNKYPSTGTYKQFYEMDRNSIDVLFLGSSVAMNNFIPQELYNDYGIRSYNLSSEQQSPLLSYYWLKEALRFQSPKLVVFEPLFLVNIHPELSINTTEGLTRKAIDPMRWSSVKVEAINDICTRDPQQSVESYYLTNIRYHDRWKALTESDFVTVNSAAPRLYGWTPGLTAVQESFEVFDENDSVTDYQLREDMVEYLERMVSLCKENGIQLIMVKVPQSGNQTYVDYAYRAIAKKNEIDYYHFGNRKYYDMLNVDPSKDNVVGHGNIYGNLKNSSLIGKIISENYGIHSITDPQFVSTVMVYNQIYTSYTLHNINNIDNYLRLINLPGYTIIFSVNGKIPDEINDSTKSLLRDFGLDGPWDHDDRGNNAYIAVINGKNVYEKNAFETGENLLSMKGSLQKHRYYYSISSVGNTNNEGGYSSIIVDNTEYSINKPGLNIVVYDQLLNKVVDSICFSISIDLEIIR